MYGLFTVAAFLAPALAVEIGRENLPATGLVTTNWTTGVLPPLSDMYCLDDMQIAAKNVLSPEDYASYRTGSLDEITYESNLHQWKKIRLNGFDFEDVVNVTLNTTILGYNFSLPFFIAPAARAGYTNKSAEASLAQGAGKAGILYAPSIESSLTLQEIAAAALPGQVMFHQEYVWSNKTRLRDELAQIEAAGYKAIFMTVDNTGIGGLRTRYERFTGPDEDLGHEQDLTMKNLIALKNYTTLPIVPKGIKTWQDAVTAMEGGFKAIYVSNHGGRVLDGAPTPVEILLDIRKNAPQVFENMEVYADGGVRRGTHVITLLALGARAVGLGRSPIFSNIWGVEGVSAMISMLETELTASLRLVGQSNIHLLNSSYVNTKVIEQMYFGQVLSS